ncbi:MAG: hypothetical protein ACOZAN_02835 [Patescibacteria group bacterium]
MIEETVLPEDKSRLSVEECQRIFHSILNIILDSRESFFARAPFVVQMVQNYVNDNDKSAYFTTDGGFGANIIVDNGVAKPSIDLNIEKGLKSRNLRRRIAIRLGRENVTDEDIFRFAVGHELGHLIQGLADYVSLEDMDLNRMAEAEALKREIARYNQSVQENEAIKKAQSFFLMLFDDDIDRAWDGTCLDSENYTVEEYSKYVNSTPETNADFIALWIMGMDNVEMEASPQNGGYSLNDWKKWAENHRIDVAQIT